MPIYLLELNEERTIIKITGNDEIRLHLKNLGFNVGEKITVIHKAMGNLIVKVKGISVAVGPDLAKRILV